MSAAARVVISLFGMLAAIQFNDEHGIGADEVDDVVLDFMLATKFVAIQEPIAQAIPELLSTSVMLVRSVRARSTFWRFILKDSFVEALSESAPHLNPLPGGERRKSASQ